MQKEALTPKREPIHPERFWEKTNQALQCASCTDKLCTQYCQKLRK